MPRFQIVPRRQIAFSPDRLRLTTHFSDTIHLAVKRAFNQYLNTGRFVPVKNRIIIIIVLLIVVFFAGFVPQYVKVNRLENELSAAKQENDLAQLRDLAALALIQASQKNYGLAAGTSQRFFSQTREVGNRAPDANTRKALQDLLASQEKIAAELVKGDQEVLGDLQALFEKTRQATGSIYR